MKERLLGIFGENEPMGFTYKLNGAINQEQVLGLEFFLEIAESSPESEIEIRINSGGGDLNSSLDMGRLLHYVKNPVKTVAVERAMSGAVLVLALGDKGNRWVHEDTDLLIHQTQFTLPEFHGSAPELKEETSKWLRANRKFARAMAEATGLPVSRWLELTKNDNYITPTQAIEYGIADHIIPRVRRQK